MKTQLLATASAVLLIASPALAVDTQVKTNTEVKAETSAPSFKEDVKRAWEDTKEDVSEAAESATEAAKDAYENIEATVISDDKGPSKVVTIDSRATARGMISKPVYNAAGDKIGSIEDIIVDNKGDAKMVVIANGGVFGVGSKLVAFDYGLVSQRQKDGDVIMPLSQATIDQAAAFSYDKDQAGKPGVRVIPPGNYSVAQLLDGQLVDQKNETVAQVDNISFHNGVADQVIVAFDQTLGLGGKKATIGYNDMKLVQQDNAGRNVDFQLSASQAAQFETYKKTATN